MFKFNIFPVKKVNKYYIHSNSIQEKLFNVQKLFKVLNYSMF